MGRIGIVVIAAAAALVCAAPAAADVHDSIINGTAAAPGEYPAQGYLQIGNPEEGFCGGSLVGSRWFITAAHCATDAGLPLPLADLTVWLGSNTRGAGTPHAVSSIDVNPTYDPFTAQNDVAMLTLATPASQQPLRVIRTDEGAAWAAGTPARIVGWGVTETGLPPADDQLRKADLPLISDDTCSQLYGGDFDPATMVCAYDGSHDTCQGDSGGPLMVSVGGDFVLAGLTSWGMGCAEADHPGVYTRLGAAALSSWVFARHPWASFSVNGGANTGQTTQLQASSFYPDVSTPFTTFAWDLDGDGQYDDAGGASATRVFATRGPAAVGVEASRPGGDTVTYRHTLNVNGSPSAEAGGPYVIPEGGAATLSGGGSDPEGQPLSFAWKLSGEPGYDAPGQSARFSRRIDGPATLSVGLRVCDSVGGCGTDTAELRIRNVAPRANAGRDRKARVRVRVTFRGSARDGFDRVRYRWTFGDGKSARGARVSHRYRRPGRYTVRLIATDDDGGVGRDAARVRIIKRR